MSIKFSYQDVSASSGAVTRRLSVSTDPDVLSAYFAAFQLWVSFDTAAVTIESQAVTVNDPQALFAINPPSPIESSSQGLIKMAGLSLSGVAPGEDFFEITYSHAASLDPVFEFNNVLIDEDLVSDRTISTRQSDPNPGIVVEAPPSGTTVQVSQVIDTDSGYTLYIFTDSTAGFSTSQVTVGESVEKSTVKTLQQAFGVPLDVSAVVASGLTSVSFTVVDTTASLNIGLADGSSSVLAFGLATGVLTSSSTLPGSPQPGVPTEEVPTEVVEEVAADDGVNTGSGISDAVGSEVEASEVASLLPAATDAIAVYRQRLGDAVSIEAVNRDGSVVGKFIGDSDARTVRQVTNGSTELTVDIPAASGLDLLGLSGDTSYSLATTYLNNLIDSAVSATDLSTVSWNNSLKRAVTKAALDQLGRDFNLDVITPYRQVSGSDEMSIGFSGDGNAVGAINLSQVNDLVSISGYDSLIAVGPGRLLVSGSSDASVYGDVWSQEIAGGRGNDFLSGGGGTDILTGGSGSDTFELGFSGTTTITDLTASDQLAFDIFGVSTVDQLVARITGVGQGTAGLRLQFDTFAVELVGYNDIGQVSSGIVF